MRSSDRIRALRFLVLSLLIAACGAGGSSSAVSIDTLPGGIPVVTSSAPLEHGRWRVTLERELSPPRDTPGELLDPVGAVLASDGEIYVAERAPEVRRYAPDGTLLGVFGRSGEGPGEFRTATIALNGDTLVVHDIRLRRATALDRRDGTVLATAPTGCCMWGDPAVERGGAILTRSALTGAADSRFLQTVIRTRLASGATDTMVFEDRRPDGLTQWNVGRLGQFETFVPIPLMPRTLVALGPDGVVTAWSGEYRLRLARATDDTVRLYGRTWASPSIGSAERLALVERELESLVARYPASDPRALREAMPADRIPRTRPAFERIDVDDTGRTWAVSGTADPDTVLVDLFDREGRWLDQLAEPASRWRGRLAIANDRLVTIAQTDEGYPVIRIFRIERRR